MSPVFYIGLAVFTFWLTFGPKAGLYTLFYYTIPVFSFLRAPTIIHGPGIVVVVPRGARRAGAAQADGLSAFAHALRRDRRPAVFAVLLVLAVADTYRAPLCDVGVAGAAQRISLACRLPPGRSSNCRTGRSHRVSPACRIHVEFRLSLDAVDQRLQRSHSAGFPR